MATDKDTTTRTVKDAGEDVAKATRGATAEAAETGRDRTGHPAARARVELRSPAAADAKAADL